MSQRSPMNKRTTSHEVTGATRKGATSAKPARPAAESVRVVPATSKSRRAKLDRGESLAGLSRAEKKRRKQERRMLEDRIMAATNYLLKDEPEYPGRRRTWWMFLILGIIAIVVAWVLLYMIGSASNNPTVAAVSITCIVLAYVFIIGGFIYDYVRIRPLRNKVRAHVEGLSEAKLIAVLERASKEEAEKKAAKGKKKSE